MPTNKIDDSSKEIALNPKEKKVIKIIKEKKKSKLDHDVYEMRFTSIIERYMKTSFIFDFLACVPVLLYDSLHGFTTDEDQIEVILNSGWYYLWNFLKICKLAQIIRIRETLTQF